MPSTPVRPLSNHLVINTHNLSQAHNRGSPRSATAAMTLKDSHRPTEKRHSIGHSSLGTNGNGGSNNNLFQGHGHLGHGHGHSRPRQSLMLTLLRILAAAPGLFGMMYSLSVSSDNNFFEQQLRQQQQQQQLQGSFQSINNEAPLTRSDFWVASMWCMLSMYWAFLLTTACIQRLLQSYRPPSVVLRIALAHLLSWIMIGAIVTSRPVTEPTRPWVFITFMQSLLLIAVVYLPWLKSQMKAAGLPTLSERLTSHALEDGFMGREINGHSATRFLVLPLIVVGLCSWMLIITRGSSGYLHDSSQGGLVQGSDQPANGYSPSNFAGSFMKEGERQQDDRMVISMIVLSSATPQGFRNRQMFRNTTLRLFPSPRNKAVVVKYRFIIGKSLPTVEHELEQEHNLMGDLLIVSTPDRPDSKSQKLYKAIEWADAFEFDYLVKTEDDVLVRVDTLSGELYKQGKKPYFWKGLVFKNVPNTHLDDMDLKEMPVFTDGTLTTMSRDIVRLLAVPAPRYFVASSAQSLGIWLHGYGIKPVHDTRIQPGAFVCEEDLIAKHFDNEISLYNYPRDDPIKMVERINRIRAELKANKNNRNFQTSISICDPLIQKRCAMCYSCQGRASNWKLMGFDCKQGGVVVGDKYRKPDLLDAKQMDELLNRPSTGVTEGLTSITLKDYRQRQQIQSQNQVNSESTDEEVSETEEDPEEESLGEEESSGDEAEGEEETDSEEESALVNEQEAESEDELSDTQEEEEEEEDGAGEEEGEEQDESNHEHHDESEIPISDQEVDFLDRRHDEDQLPAKEIRKKKSQ